MDATAYEHLRPKLEGIAYRMTGSSADAQDVVQDAWLRWTSSDRSEVVDPEAYLVRIVTRLSLDRLRSASRRRETYVGPYLPEPVAGGVTDSAVAGPISPEDHALLADSLTYSFLVLVDELEPVERAVLLLHDVFGYPFDEVAAAVDRTPEAVRQVASRTRRRIAAARPGWEGDAVAGGGSPVPRRSIAPERLVDLLASMATGDVAALMDALAPGVVALSDGGALQRAARRPVVGAERVARTMLFLGRRAMELDLSPDVVEINGAAALAVRRADGTPYGVVIAEVDDDGRIDRIFIQVNPDKLGSVPPAP
ncbi:MAG: RNA polymerase sigma factor SigJ [Actinobacteria bacterium]|nr:RNA polymerase sigma factor SigJ [Actinomycetota bacterium]